MDRVELAVFELREKNDDHLVFPHSRTRSSFVNVNFVSSLITKPAAHLKIFQLLLVKCFLAFQTLLIFIQLFLNVGSVLFYFTFTLFKQAHVLNT